MKSIFLKKFCLLSGCLLLSLFSMYAHTTSYAIRCAPNKNVWMAPPSNIISFSANAEAKHIKLCWTTSNEADKTYFTIEKSVDGKSFESVEKIDGMGNGYKDMTYTAMDYNVADGVCYYRVKQTDINGKSYYSNLAAINISLKGEFNFFVSPNPTDGKDLKLQIRNITYGKLQIKIYNLIGREMYTNILPVTTAGDFTTTIDLPDNLPSGNYFVTIDANNSVCTKKFIIRR